MRLYKVALLGALALLLVFNAVGGYMESQCAFADESAVTAKWISIAVSLVLFLVIVYSAIPLAIHQFIKAQIRIGNGSVPAITCLQANEGRVRLFVWVFISIGFAIALPVMVFDMINE